jgi:hypothetical protein
MSSKQCVPVVLLATCTSGYVRPYVNQYIDSLSPSPSPSLSLCELCGVHTIHPMY